ncbi:MAG: 4-hydroxy-tetrahydrodipicolinate reductase, partial [Deltaproteobacteria bacterium]|nr:4-hydroxy-tetrahydrodipicolinate reductase [Deltaproteobacteria bacterium]
MVKVIVLGAGGKMGGRIISLISSTDGIRVAGAVERKGHPL